MREAKIAFIEAVRFEIHSLRGHQFAFASAATANEVVQSPLLPDFALRPADLVADRPWRALLSVLFFTHGSVALPFSEYPA